MAQFGQTVTTFWGVLSIAATIYLWPVAMRTLSAAAAHPRDSSSPSPSPSSAMEICSAESLDGKADTSLRWMGATFASAVWIMLLLKMFVDRAAAAETNIMVDEAHKLAREELKPTIKAVWVALNASTPDSRDDYVKAIGLRNVAMTNVARTKPREGLARLPRRMRALVRAAFLFALSLSFVSGCFAAASFHYPLQLRAGCITGGWEIVAFALVGSAFSLAHLQLAVVAWTRD